MQIHSQTAYKSNQKRKYAKSRANVEIMNTNVSRQLHATCKNKSQSKAKSNTFCFEGLNLNQVSTTVIMCVPLSEKLKITLLQVCGFLCPNEPVSSFGCYGIFLMRVQKPDCMYFTNLQNEGTCHRYARILVSDVCSYEDEMFV